MLLRLISAGAIIVGALSALPSPAGAQDATVTGCLTQTGRIVKVAVGEEPARPCGPRQTQISWRLGGDDEEDGPEHVDFFLAMESDGPDKTIATNGPLEVFAQCYTSTIAGDLRVHFEIKVTSDVDGWWVLEKTAPEPANEEVVILDASARINGPARRFLNGYERRFTHAALAPDGSYVAVEPDTLSVGLDILGHNCIAIGTAILKQVDLE